MIKWDLNNRLWRSDKHWLRYISATNSLNRSMSNQPYIADDFLTIANNLDDIMQDYELNYCQIEDPMFFFAFATSNALFLQIGKKFDEMGSTRIGYIVNGYKEGLTKHLLYPSYNLAILKVLIETFFQFANDDDKNWLNDNRFKFVPYEINEEN